VIRCSALRLLAIAAAVALIPALAGCAAGRNAQTNQSFDTTNGASTVFNNIAIRNVFVLGSDPSTALQPGQSASMFLALVNNGSADQLTTVSAPGTAASVTIQGGTVKLLVGRPALLTGPEPRLVLSGLTRSLTSGQSILMALTFQNAGTVTMAVPVIAPIDYYATFSPPPPTPTPTPTPTPSKKRASKSPQPSPSSSAGSAGATPTPSTTP
jgi:copper(I)-binding protein